MYGMGLIDPFGQAKICRDVEKTTLECKRIMEDIYSPSVAGFMLELAQSRDRLQQLRDLVLMGLETDQVRRLIMSGTYYPANMIVGLKGLPGPLRFTLEIQGRFNLRRWVTFRIRYLASKVRYMLIRKERDG